MENELHNLKRDHAVTNEARVREDHLEHRRVLDRDARGLGLAQALQDLVRRLEQTSTAFVRRIDRREREITAGIEGRRILEHRATPLDGAEHFRCADAAVLIGVHKGQRALIDLKPLHRARQRHPELLIEFTEMAQVVSRLERDLVGAAGAEEAPRMLGRGHGCRE